MDSSLARGGEIIIEKAACAGPPSAECQFPYWPGTVAWKSGYHALKDAPVFPNGDEVTVDDLDDWNAGATKRRRFDRNRRGLFHYVLYVHARGKPVSPFPCLGGDGYYNDDGVCDGAPNPDFHIPRSSSGAGDLPGGNVMVSLAWDEFVARPYVRAATLFHELGHNLGLWHGGAAPSVWGSKAANTTTNIEPNCKWNYHSTMNYLFQKFGLYDKFGFIQIDYSDRAYDEKNETNIQDDADLSLDAPYQPAWYAPADSLLANGKSAATRHCGGQPFTGINPQMTRVTLQSPVAPNFRANGTLTGTAT